MVEQGIHVICSVYNICAYVISYISYVLSHWLRTCSAIHRKTAHHLRIVGIEVHLCYEERPPMGFYHHVSYGKFGMNDIPVYLN